jgi:hypothetical protein
MTTDKECSEEKKPFLKYCCNLKAIGSSLPYSPACLGWIIIIDIIFSILVKFKDYFRIEFDTLSFSILFNLY